VIFRRNATIAAAGIVAAGALSIPLGLTSGSGSVDVFVGSTPTTTASLTCDQTITTRTALNTALTSSGTSGKTLCVTADITGAAISPNQAFASRVRVVAQPYNQTISMVSMNFGTSRNISFKGFVLDGTTTNTVFDFGNSGSGSSDGIHVISSKCGGSPQYLACFNGQGATDINGTWLIGNQIGPVFFNSADGSGNSGYGFYGRNWDDMRIEFNTCDQNSTESVDYGRDCYEIDNPEDFTFKSNIGLNTACSDCATTHPDCFMLWNTPDRGVVQDNVCLRSLEVLISPDGSDMQVTNNLSAQFQTNCFDAHENGSSGDVAPLRYTFTHNTAIDCNRAFPQPGGINGGGLLMNGTVGARGGNVWQSNLMPNSSCQLSGFASAPTGNVFFEGTNPCGLSTVTNSISTFTPNWGTTDLASAGDGARYQLLNPPTGYTGVGYQTAPVGYLDCPDSLCGAASTS
jgi:hypothetical protein